MRFIKMGIKAPKGNLKLLRSRIVNLGTLRWMCAFAISILMTSVGHIALSSSSTAAIFSATTPRLSDVASATCNIANVRVRSFSELPHITNKRIIINIVREYGPASFGGMGAALTALTTSMAALSSQSLVIAILPAYPFLLRATRFKVVGDAINRNGSTTGHVYAHRDNEKVLILPLEMAEPLKFFAEAVDGIYSEKLTTNKHACFNIFAAMIVSVLSTRFPNTIVHVHGSLNGLIPTLLRLDQSDTSRKVVYTMHDVSSEFESGIPAKTIQSGWATIETPLPPCPVLRSDMCITMGLAIRDADAVTGVSQGLISHLLKSQCDECELLRRRNQTFVTGIPWTVHGSKKDGMDKPLDVFAKKRRAKESLCSTLDEDEQLMCMMGPMIGFVGRFEHLKGADVVFHMLDKCREINQIYGIATIGIVGLPSREPVSTRILQLLSTMSDGCIVFSATSREAQKAIGNDIRHAIDVQVAPSMSEGFGLALVEAIDAGAYPVASYNPGFEDIIDERDGLAALENGFVVACSSQRPCSGQILAMARSALAAATIAAQQMQAPSHISAAFTERFPSHIMHDRLLSARHRARKLACANHSEECGNLPIISLNVPETQEIEFRRQLLSLCVGFIRFRVISVREADLRGNRSCGFFSMVSLHMDKRAIMLAADASISLGSPHLFATAGRSGSCPVAETYPPNHANRTRPFQSMGIVLRSKHYIDFVRTAAGTAYLLNAMNFVHRQAMLLNLRSSVYKKFGAWNSMHGPAGRYIRLYDALTHAA